MSLLKIITIEVFKFFFMDIKNIEEQSKKLIPISKIHIDLLTIVIGTEHHDIRLLEYKVNFFLLKI